MLLPAMPDCKDIVVCGNVPIAKLTVKAAYSFLLRRDFADRRSAPRSPLKLPRIFPLINNAQLTKRWQWIASSPLPAKVRQTLWRRWHNRLWLGPESATADDAAAAQADQAKAPLCPYHPHQDDSLTHFAYMCAEAAAPAQAYLAQCWQLWTDYAVDPLWLTKEWAGKQAGWMLAFACLHHALYAGRMHRLDARFARDRPISLLLYVLALFRKLVHGIAQATVGHLTDARLRDRLKKLGWPDSWCEVGAFAMPWPPLPGAATPAPPPPPHSAN